MKIEHKPFITVYEVSEKLYKFIVANFPDTNFHKKKKGKCFVKLGKRTREWIEKQVGPLKTVTNDINF